MSVQACDSEEMEAEKAPAIQALDGKLNTEWISQWKSAQPNYPHEIVIALKTPRTLSGLELVKRASGANAPKNFEVFGSSNGQEWSSLYKGVMPSERKGHFSFDSKKKIHFLKIVFLDSQDGTKHIALSEIIPLTQDPIPYALDLSRSENKKIDSWFKLGGKNPQGDELNVNSLYWSKNNQAWTPVMGEFHYFRFPSELWELELLKMKAGGVSIVSTYIPWEFVENPKGTWDWTGDNDLKTFVELCKKHDLYVWLRPGPYINGEARNKGLPAWTNKNGKRSNADWYLKEVKDYYAQVAQQVKGLYFKNGGPIIGCQLENEYAHGSKDHLDALKQIAVDVGIDVPFYSSTANSEYHYEKGDILPLQGAYPYRYWETPRPTSDFLYTTDEWGAMENLGRLYYDMEKFPRGMCELGGGCLNSYQHRFIVPPYTMEGHTQNVLGRGMNLLGYYMFHGGTHKLGYEDKGGGCAQNFDYQAPLGEFGQVREAYKRLKLLHFFMNDFGNLLGTTQPVRPETPINDPYNVSRARYIGRFDRGRGFLFMNTTQPWVDTHPVDNVQFQINIDGKPLNVPLDPITLPKNTSPIFPVNLDLNGTDLIYGTAQLMAKVGDQNAPTYVFFIEDGIRPEFCFAQNTDARIKTDAPHKTEGTYTRYFPKPGSDMALTVTSPKGSTAHIILLSRKDAENAWRMNIKGQERLVISEANLTQNKDSLELAAYTPTMKMSVYPPLKESILKQKPVLDGVFASYTFTTPKANIDLKPGTLPSKSLDLALSKLQLPPNVRDVLIRVNYTGSTAKLFTGDTLYTDNRHIGEPFEFTLKRFLLKNVPTLKVTIDPWDDKVQGIPQEFAPTNDAEKQGMIRSVEILPEYTITLPGL